MRRTFFLWAGEEKEENPLVVGCARGDDVGQGAERTHNARSRRLEQLGRRRLSGSVSSDS